MLRCLTLKSLTSSSGTAVTSPTCLPGNSSQDTPTTPGTSALPSPTVNLSQEYALAVQTSSYNEIWSKIHVVEHLHSNEADHQQQLLLSDVLQPDRESVEEVLQHASPSTFTELVTAYFEHSEKTCQLLLLLHHNIHHARSLYGHVHDLVGVLPTDTESMSELQCNHAFDVFLQFEQKGNPFPCPDSHNFHDMRLCFFQLKQQVDQRLEKSRGKVRQVRCGTTTSAICLIGAVVGVTIAAIAIGAHALVALVATSSCPIFHPSKFTKREKANMEQLDAAAMSAFVLHHSLDTIDRLVSLLHTEIDGDRLLIRRGLDWGRDKYLTHEVVKQLRKNRDCLYDQLTDLDEKICLCFAAINRTRSLLLNGIPLYQM
ncbi:UPF0496 protein At3g19330 isoform X2 [Spinacia oleracea]|uniref:UPF0496 protein At3g19330 isoform X2 n=1 Tax=Spinacia oleracea TaxID=3562 RepID=A0A9R0JXE2_SPIOL|nr:UPF0496 protein At3g19330-like isoform X2 [Spinacia oleracea]